MSDNLRRYRAIRDALTQGYPGQPTGTVARHLTTLAALISGIVGSKSTQLPSVATKIPDGTKPESRVKRFARWLDNERILEEMYFLPYAEILLTHLALETLVLVMDGSVLGRGCLALMLHVIYKGRALPLAWRVRQSPKGHCPEDLHIALVELMSMVIPAGAKVVFLGDGEFDGTALQATLSALGWSYVCRTALSPEGYEELLFQESESVLVEKTTDLLRIFNSWSPLELAVWQGRSSGKTVQELEQELGIDYRRISEMCRRLLKDIESCLEVDLQKPIKRRRDKDSERVKEKPI
jgi:hypothetical protein